MINLKWSILDSADAVSFRIYRSLIGFEFPVEGSEGKLLTFKVNNKNTISIRIQKDPLLSFDGSKNLVSATLSSDGKKVIVRNNLRTAPGSIQIVGGELPLNVRTISYLSEDTLVGTVPAEAGKKDYIFVDNDGSISDGYAISVVNSVGDESKKSSYQNPVNASGDICCVCGVLANLSGKRIADATIKAYLCIPPESLSGSMVTNEPVETISDMDGRFSLPLLQGSLVKLEIDKIGYGKVVKIPAQSFVMVDDLEIDDEYQFDPKTRENL